MPEGPEVFVMTKRLRTRCLNTQLTAIEALCERYRQGAEAKALATFCKALPLKVVAVTSKGKKTIVRFEEVCTTKRCLWRLLISYGMSGHWETKKSKYAQLRFTFQHNSGRLTEYYWVSARSLPTCSVQFLKRKALQEQLSKLGLDIIRTNPSNAEVLALYEGTRKMIGAFLMEQNKICGIGNYLRSVVLYRCRVAPKRPVHKLTNDEKLALWNTAKQVAKEAIANRGMGMRDYKDEGGNVVGVHFDITPYNCKEDHDGNLVETCKVGGRVVWWVPQVQK